MSVLNLNLVLLVSFLLFFFIFSLLFVSLFLSLPPSSLSSFLPLFSPYHPMWRKKNLGDRVMLQRVLPLALVIRFWKWLFMFFSEFQFWPRSQKTKNSRCQSTHRRNTKRSLSKFCDSLLVAQLGVHYKSWKRQKSEGENFFGSFAYMKPSEPRIPFRGLGLCLWAFGNSRVWFLLNV